MINIKVTSRMSHEDYVALYTASPYILPKKHILGIGASVLLSAVLVLPMPSTWQYFQDPSELTADSQAYLATDQRAQELSVSQEQPDRLQENYEDYDIPSHFFQLGQLSSTGTGMDADSGAGASLGAESNTTTTATATTDSSSTSSSEQLASHEDKTESTSTEGTKSSIADTSSTSSTEQEQQLAATGTGTDTDTSKKDTSSTQESADTTITSSDTESKTLSSNESESKSKDASETETIAETVRPTGTWYKQTVKPGDNLSKIFTYLDLPYATLNRITKVASAKDISLSVGEDIYFLIDENNVVKEMVKNTGSDKEEQVRFTRLSDSDDFKVVYEKRNSHASEEILAKVADASTMPLAVAAQKARDEREAKLLAERKAKEEQDKANNVNPNRPRLVINALASGESFAQAGRRAGLTPSEIKTIQEIFKNKLNFKRLHSGDKFRVLFTGIGTSALISAVQLETSQGNFESFMNPDDRNYYGENEFTPTAGIFRRFPLSGEIKVNSNFNPHRRHPVTRRISPHNGVDFKAKIGTPVYAPADGEVSFSGYQRAAGYYVIIRHTNNFSTVYMHLSKSEVKTGQKVIVGQLIARTGNTGRTTGPHLHYEIRINDRPVNPLKVELPSAEHPNLAREQREAFANNVRILRADLQNDRLAIANP